MGAGRNAVFLFSFDPLYAKSEARLAIRCLNPALAVTSKSIIPVGARSRAYPHEFEETDQLPDCRRVYRMFDAACIGLGIFRTELEGGHEEILEGLVPSDHVMGYVATCGGERDVAVRTVVYEAASSQCLECAGYGCPLDTHLVGDVFGTGYPVGLFEMEYNFEIVLQAR